MTFQQIGMTACRFPSSVKILRVVRCMPVLLADLQELVTSRKSILSEK